MTELIEFETERLRLRQWKSADRAPFAALNDDKRVMEFFPSRLSRAGSDSMADRCESLIHQRGWGPLGRRAEGERRVYRLRRPPYARGAAPLLAVRRNRMAPRLRTLAKRPGDGSGERGAPNRISALGLSGDRILHRREQQTIPRRHGAPRNDRIRPLRASQRSGGERAAAALFVSGWERVDG